MSHTKYRFYDDNDMMVVRSNVRTVWCETCRINILNGQPVPEITEE